MLPRISAIALTLNMITSAFSILCSPGSHLHTTANGGDICLPCDTNTFMPLKYHTERLCYNCTGVLLPELEILISNCSQTDDSVIVCKEGYYRTAKGKDAENRKCAMCVSCEHVGRRCQNDSNAICCPGVDYDVIDNRCQKKPFVCGPGEYKTGDNCLPCEDSTFNYFSNHSNTDCKNCSKPSKYLDEIEVKPCNKTHDTVIRCKGQKFWKDSGVRGVKGNCEICKDCTHSTNNYFGRNCTNISDTVCCTRPYMDVDETGQCVEKAEVSTPMPVAVVCGKGQYLDNKTSSMEPTCAACSNGSYQDKVNHTDTDCQNCTEFKGQHLPQTCPEPEKTIHNGYTNVILISFNCGVAIVFSVFVIAICIVIVKNRERTIEEEPIPLQQNPVHQMENDGEDEEERTCTKLLDPESSKENNNDE